jgi:hypothetical protein
MSRDTSIWIAGEGVPATGAHNHSLAPHGEGVLGGFQLIPTDGWRCDRCIWVAKQLLRCSAVVIIRALIAVIARRSPFAPARGQFVIGLTTWSEMIRSYGTY